MSRRAPRSTTGPAAPTPSPARGRDPRRRRRDRRRDTNTASTFSGTATGLVATQTPVVGPQVFSVEAWFKTTTTAGGKIVGFGNTSTGNSSSYDRHVYMDDQRPGVRSASTRARRRIVTSTEGVQRRHVAPRRRRRSSAGGRGALRRRRAGRPCARTRPRRRRTRATGASVATRRGPAPRYFAGSIDDVAIYPTALTGATVDAHWTKAGHPSTFPAAPADAYGAAVFGQSGDAPEVYWRLNESSGSTAASAGPWPSDGGVRRHRHARASRAPWPAWRTTRSRSRARRATSSCRSATISEPDAPTARSCGSRRRRRTGGKLIGFGNAQHRDARPPTTGTCTWRTTGGSRSASGRRHGHDHDHHAGLLQQRPVAPRGRDAVLGRHEAVRRRRACGPPTRRPRRRRTRATGGSVATPPGVRSRGSPARSTRSRSTPSALTAGAGAPALPAGRAARPNVAPTAAFSWSNTNLTADLDGTASADPDGTISSYAWTFGDGATLTGANATPSHPYATAGTYTGDARRHGRRRRGLTGASRTTSRSRTRRTCCRTRCSRPTVQPDGRTVNVTAAASNDPDGTIASYAWAFGPSGTGTGVTSSYTFPADGTYTITLTVTDNRGGTATTQRVRHGGCARRVRRSSRPTRSRGRRPAGGGPPTSAGPGR